jgi:hypothetical protein
LHLFCDVRSKLIAKNVICMFSSCCKEGILCEPDEETGELSEVDDIDDDIDVSDRGRLDEGAEDEMTGPQMEMERLLHQEDGGPEKGQV